MTTNQVEHNYPSAPDQYSVSATFIWMFVLAFGVQLLVVTAVVFLMTVIGYDVDDAISFSQKLDVGFILAVVATMISYPILKKACYHGDDRGLPLGFLAIKPIKLPILLAVAGSVALLLLGEYVVANWLAVPAPDFILEVKNNVQNSKDLVFVLLHICLLAPVVEEFIFRGMAYRRIELSRFGSKGAVIITSLVFTFIHLQYSWMVLLLLLPGSFLLGLIRYKTGNLYYCIFAHMLMNTTSMVALFVFPEHYFS